MHDDAANETAAAAAKRAHATCAGRRRCLGRHPQLRLSRVLPRLELPWRRMPSTNPFPLLNQAAAADGGSEAAAVLVRNLPSEAGQSHLAAFFAGFRLHPNGLQLGYHGPTTRTGQVSRPQCAALQMPLTRLPMTLLCWYMLSLAFALVSSCVEAHAAAHTWKVLALCPSGSSQRCRVLFQRLQAFVEFGSPEEATRAVAALDRQPLLPEASKRFVRLEQVLITRIHKLSGQARLLLATCCTSTLPA
jgi:hypothetical protein